MPSGPGPIPDERIAAIATRLPPPIAGFLLTSETTAEAIADHVRRTSVSTVQIVSHLDPRESAGLARLLPAVRRVQVIHVEDRRVRPFGVDLCSGVRVAGRLNRERLTAFVAAVQATDRARDETMAL